MQGFLITMLVCSVTMSELVLIYMAVLPCLTKHYSARSLYYTWLVFVVGLIVPFRPEFGSAIVKADIPGRPSAPIIPIGMGGNVPTKAPAFLPTADIPDISWWQIAVVLWLAGMFLFLFYHIIRHCHFLKLTAHWSENITDEQILQEFHSMKKQMGLTRNIGLKVCDCIGSPMLIGLVHPRILLPRTGFTKEELCFILKHELVHYKRKDLWYKCLVLAAAAIHWFNPVIHIMAKAIDVQCELSCDAEVVYSTGADTRQSYSETIIGVIRYQSKLKTSLSTNFYGGKKGMKKRIFSIMDMGKKRVGAAVLCGALILTIGTGFAFAANEEGKSQSPNSKEIAVAPWILAQFTPSPEIYAPYAPFGITISEDGSHLLYKGQPVRQFVDEKADGWAFYLDEAGDGNWVVARNASGEITGIESMAEQKAQEYYEGFFAEELGSDYLAKVKEEAVRDLVMEAIEEEGKKYEEYQPFGITYSEEDKILYFHGQRIKFFIDRSTEDTIRSMWTDDAGTVNVAVIRNASGQITKVESITDEKAKEYQSAVEDYMEEVMDGLEESIEAKMNERYHE